MSLLLAILLAQPAAIRTTTPAARDYGLVTRSAGNVSVVNSPDAGSLTVQLAPYGLTSFGSIRVAAPYTLADLTNIASFDQTEHFGTKLDGGTIAWLSTEAALLLQANGSQGFASTRTHDSYRYQAGKGQLVLNTGCIPTALDAGVYRLGYFDDNDGLYWQGDYQGLKFCRRSSTDGGVTDYCHLTDAGTSGWVSSFCSIYETRFQWLGVGEVQGWLNGQQVATMSHANTLPQVYMAAAFLPVSYEVKATGTATAQLKQICTSVQSEGGSDPYQHTYAFKRPTDLTVGTGTTDAPVLGLRVSSTYRGRPNRAQAYPRAWGCVSDSKRVNARMVINPTVQTNAGFAVTNDDSSCEVDTSATVVSGGYEVAAQLIPANNAKEQNLESVFGETRRHLRRRAFYGLDAGPGLDTGLDTIYILVSNPGAGNATVNCFVEWSEIR